jgi:HEPN domain-containing protein
MAAHAAYHAQLDLMRWRPPAMNRFRFQELAEIRIEESMVLLSQGKYDGAYYLAGYAVECALKACIAKLTNQYDFAPKPAAIREHYSHEIRTLVKTAGLFTELSADLRVDPELEANWNLVERWSEESRYERRTQADAEDLITAITDPDHGALTWIKQRW